MIIQKTDSIKAIKKRIDSFQVWRNKKEIPYDNGTIEADTLLHITSVKHEDGSITLHVRDSESNAADIVLPANEFDEYFEEARDKQDEINEAVSLFRKEDTLDRVSDAFSEILRETPDASALG